MRTLALAALASLLAPPAQAATRRLLLLGGADRSPQAMRRFVDWAGGAKGRILVVPYATEDPEGYAKDVVDEVSAFSPIKTEVAVTTATLARKGGKAFLDQLSRASAVFFTGGDQVRLMGVLSRHGLVRPLRERHRAGLPFAGTSAGTAVMSDPMITGEGDFEVIDGDKVETAEGLGALEGTITDQHFLRRKRANRLMGAILKRPDLLGVGVDETSALAVTDGRVAEVVETGSVVIVAAERGSERLAVEVLRPGQRYDLLERRRLP